MSETKFTPGPWMTGGIFMPDSDRPSVNIWGPAAMGMQSGEVIAKDVTLLNARLIAAAPELLEACKTVKAFLDSLGPADKTDPLHAIRMRTHAPLYAKLNPAIAKAEG